MSISNGMVSSDVQHRNKIMAIHVVVIYERDIMKHERGAWTHTHTHRERERERERAHIERSESTERTTTWDFDNTHIRITLNADTHAIRMIEI